MSTRKKQDASAFFANVRKRLDAIGVSQNQFADLLEIDRTQMSRWMTGRVASPRYDTAMMIEAKLAQLEAKAAKKGSK